ncbi:DUF4307 domain-containing protein [Nocardia vermiculata]|uniref:DUF4307 domain-containing protein n=1 Tax=Nocardia vermiculata TaxID=257274 RepID=A0A846XS67_9NOCA|nr:DUF4307 domain-containing protein [Nocardia vermiculata]NKY48932.1 DUF4307 domain-containing protein [Nocardia vermiculata]
MSEAAPQSDRSDSDGRTADAATGAAAATDRVSNRYGTKPTRSRRTIVIVLGVGLVIGAIIAFVLYRQYGPQDIQPDRIGYDVIDDSTMTIQFKVTREHPDQPVVCVVRAMDADTNEVGRREVLIPASDSGTVELTTTLRTTARAGNGSIYGCSGKVPDYLKAG